ncbi:MAG: autotransporter outer membrane beta-barrel domain-containing protein [Candidatus Accumulibacter sp.]|jgi:hypothetical protein|nr:autotransporter outer membrane beta-barrel domain-containing protein [Accumulibacter sp.]
MGGSGGTGGTGGIGGDGKSSYGSAAVAGVDGLRIVAGAGGGGGSGGASDSGKTGGGSNGGAGGASTGGQGGVGGAGGGAEMKIEARGDTIVDNGEFRVHGGRGGNGGSGNAGAGGMGGGATLTVEDGVSIKVLSHPVSIRGGDGGGNAGGAGGGAQLTLGAGSSLSTTENFEVHGGDGGGSASGGNAALVANDVELSVGGDLEVRGGANAVGTGGIASLQIQGSGSKVKVGGDLAVDSSQGGTASFAVKNTEIEVQGSGNNDVKVDAGASWATFTLEGSSLTLDGNLSLRAGSGAGAHAELSATDSTITVGDGTTGNLTLEAGTGSGAYSELTLERAPLKLDGNLSLAAGAGQGAFAALHAVAAPLVIGGDLSVRADAAQARMSADANSPVFLAGNLRVEGSANADAVLDFGGTLTLAGTRDRAQPQTIAAVHGGSGASIGLAAIDVREHTWLTSDAAGNSFKLGQARVFDDKDLRIFNAPGEIEVGDLTLVGKGRVYVEDPMRPGVRGMTLNARGADLSVITQASVGAYGSTGVPVLAVDKADIRNANLSVDDAPYKGRIALTRDQFVRLIQTDNGVTASTYYYRTRTSLGDRFSIDVRGKNVDLALMSPSVKSYTEGAAAGLSFVGQGGVFVLSRGVGSALKATSGTGTRSEFFSEFGYDQHKYETGSYVKVRGGSLVVGIARGSDAGDGRATVGAFFESGWGNYDTYNSFPQTPAVEGDGKVAYYGLGALARYDDPSGFHADAAFRAGQSKTDFSTGDIRYTTVNQGLGKAHFETDAMYFSLIAGLGHQLKLFDRTTLDVSTHLLWTRQTENSTKVHFDKLKFDAADSLRSRIGARLTYALDERTDLYAGAYWDREHEGNTKASLNGLKIYDAATLRGDTGVGEIGVHIRPAKVSNFSLDLSAQAYAGEKKGAAANLRFKWVF